MQIDGILYVIVLVLVNRIVVEFYVTWEDYEVEAAERKNEPVFSDRYIPQATAYLLASPLFLRFLWEEPSTSLRSGGWIGIMQLSDFMFVGF